MPNYTKPSIVVFRRLSLLKSITTQVQASTSRHSYLVSWRQIFGSHVEEFPT